MQHEIRQVENIAVITIQEQRFDAKIAVDFKKQMIELIKDGQHNFVLNLANVKFMDSSGLGAIISTLKESGRKGDIVLCGINAPSIKTLLSLTRMDKILRIFDDEAEALKNF